MIRKLIGIAMTSLLAAGCQHSGDSNRAKNEIASTPDAEFLRWRDQHIAVVQPLELKQNLAYWKASANGRPEDYDAVSDTELEVSKVYADSEQYQYLKQLRDTKVVRDPVLRRQLERLYLAYLGNQFDQALMKEIITLSSSIEEKFNTYRAEVDGQRLADNEVDEVLRSNQNNQTRQKVWEASKRIGSVVSNDLLQLVKLRNQAAKQLGFSNYYILALELGEQSEDQLFSLLDDMATQTEQPFASIKADLDEALAKHYSIGVSQLRPWHYQDRFFQEAPSVGTIDLNPYYKDRDIIELTSAFYDSIGLPVRDIMTHSDLKGRVGKYQHAYCMDMDRKGDI